VVGTLGLVDRLDRRPPGPVLVPGSHVVLIGAGVGAGSGAAPFVPSLAGSRWAVELHDHKGGRLPDLDLELHGRLLRLVQELVAARQIDGLHDVSEGGLGVALAEMAGHGDVGFRVKGITGHAALFGEGPSRVVLSVPAPVLDQVQAQVEAAGIGWVGLGVAGGDRLVVAGLLDVSLADATAAWNGALPQTLGDNAIAAGTGPT
jgi:phosphoribosylformylglycinamidine synthase